MNVENGIRKRVDKYRTQEAHEPGEAHKGDCRTLQLGNKQAVIILAALASPR